MTYRHMLTCLTDPETAPVTLALAFQLGREQNAHVECLHVRNDVSAAVPLVGEGMSGAMLEEMLAVAERQTSERASQVHAQFEQARQAYDVPLLETPSPAVAFSTHWHDLVGREEEVLASAGRLSDLVVMARPLAEHDTPSLLSLNAVLLESGRPLLLAPPRLPGSIARSIAVLWNGSVEATRAIAFAMPLLHSAEKIAVLAAPEEGGALSPGDLVAYLAWHGLTASEHSFVAGAQVGHTLLDKASDLGIDLVVMGAYTHSRLRQLILGGVTRHVLQHATVPILLCH